MKTANWINSVFLIFGLIAGGLAAVGHSLQRRKLPSNCADTALVFGTGLGWKAEQRWQHAALLFHQGWVRYLIVSGGVLVPSTGLCEAEWFRDALLRLGVPDERILLEKRATNAFENAVFTLSVLQEHGFKSVVLVMSDFTGLRAHLTAKKAWQGAGIEIYDSHAPSPGHWNPWMWWMTAEGRRLTWYALSRLFRYRLLPYL